MQYIVIDLNEMDGLLMEDHQMSITREERKKVGVIDREDVALQVAQRRAKEKPTHQIAVFKIDRVFETTTPKVLTKRFNLQGELVMDKEPQ